MATPKGFAIGRTNGGCVAGFLLGPCFCLRGEFGTVLEAVTSKFVDPPIVGMNLDVMPSTPSGTADHDNGRLAKCRQVIKMILSTDMFQKFDTPHGIIRLGRPPWTAAKVMFYNPFGW
eukprot:scaffold5479_cov199-Amphora_coffeaeformis.AAC.60